MRLRRASRADQYRSETYRDLQSRLAANVRRLRAEEGWTQEEAAHQSGMATPVYQRIEAGSTNVTFTTLGRICEAYSVDPATLLASAPLVQKRPRGRPKAATK